MTPQQYTLEIKEIELDERHMYLEARDKAMDRLVKMAATVAGMHCQSDDEIAWKRNYLIQSTQTLFQECEACMRFLR
jgi:hypothetical protein